MPDLDEATTTSSPSASTSVFEQLPCTNPTNPNPTNPNPTNTTNSRTRRSSDLTREFEQSPPCTSTKMTSSYDHEQARYHVCILCLKHSNRTLFSNETFFAYVKTQCDLSDPKVPLGFCNTCRIRYTKKPSENIFNFDSIQPSNSEPCNCLICNVAKEKVAKEIFFQKRQKNLVSPKKAVFCKKCFSMIAKGKSHKCGIRSTKKITC